MSKKKINFVIPTLSGGGAERVVSTHLKMFQPFADTILTVYDPKTLGYEATGIIESLDLRHQFGPFTRLKNEFIGRRRLRAITHKHHVDVTISHLDDPCIMNVKKRTHEKTICVIHVFESARFTSRKGVKNFFRKYKQYWLMQRIYAKADLLVTVSKEIQRDLVDTFKLPKEKIRTIANPIDFETLRAVATTYQKSDKNDQGPTLITIGRLHHQKGQWHLIRIFKEVLKQHPKAELQILGQGELEEELKHLVSTLGLETSVTFLGFQENPYQYLCSADCFCFTSLYEGFGMVLLESMALGLPVVSVDCPTGPNELLNPGQMKRKTDEVLWTTCGVLTPAMSGLKLGDKPLDQAEETFLSTILEVLSNHQMRETLKQGGIFRAQDFSMESIAQLWRDLM